MELTKKYRTCPEDKVDVIPLGFDLSRFQENAEAKRKSFRAKYSIEEDEIVVGIIGRLVPIKNHKLFLDSLNIVLGKTNKKVRAFLIGDGEEREELKAYTTKGGLDFLNGDFEKGMKATVHFTSWIKDVDWANSGLDINCVKFIK